MTIPSAPESYVGNQLLRFKLVETEKKPCDVYTVAGPVTFRGRNSEAVTFDNDHVINIMSDGGYHMTGKAFIINGGVGGRMLAEHTFDPPIAVRDGETVDDALRREGRPPAPHFVAQISNGNLACFYEADDPVEKMMRPGTIIFWTAVLLATYAALAVIVVKGGCLIC